MMIDERNGRYINPYTDFGFKKLFDQAEIAKYNPAERREYEASVKDYWDYYSTMKTAADNAADKRAKSIAQKMKTKGFALEDIAEVTGLSLDVLKLL